MTPASHSSYKAVPLAPTPHHLDNTHPHLCPLCMRSGASAAPAAGVESLRPEWKGDVTERLPMRRRSDPAVRKLRPHPQSFGGQCVGVFRAADGDIVFALVHPDGDGTLYAPVPAEVACLITQDLEDMLHCAPDGTPRPVVPLNEPLDACYDPGGVMHDRYGGIIINAGQPGGDLLVRLEPQAALDLLRDLAARLGFDLHRRGVPPTTPVEARAP